MMFSDQIWQFVTLAASAGILSALVTAGLSGIGRYYDRRSKARYLALRISVSLEHYADDMVRRLYADANSKSSGGQVGEELIYLPEIPDYPADDQAWPILDSSLATRALFLQLSILSNNRHLKDTYELIDEDGQPFALERAAEMARDSAILARDLRYKYELSLAETTNDLLEHCNSMVRRYDRMRQGRNKEG